ncbi:hypothetical protein [Pararhodobacter sp. SW119]|uniref:hypothetical protein n=1 Tax=Pararhodobacter sp. SW119 TaxID=2780075 RepID=UPI001AE09AAB|nr:hypothetical protein [Pararhodobacter sp. SW119]
MRAALPALALLLLSACLPGRDAQVAPGEDRIEVTALEAAPDAGTGTPAVEVAEVPEVGPEEQETATEPVPSPAEADAPPLPPFLAAEARACEARGGTLRPRGTGGLWSCVRAMRDAGRACRSGADCEGLCLARSGTCAPFEPLYGCHEALDRTGRSQTVCRE